MRSDGKGRTPRSRAARSCSARACTPCSSAESTVRCSPGLTAHRASLRWHGTRKHAVLISPPPSTSRLVHLLTTLPRAQRPKSRRRLPRLAAASFTTLRTRRTTASGPSPRRLRRGRLRVPRACKRARRHQLPRHPQSCATGRYAATPGEARQEDGGTASARRPA